MRRSVTQKCKRLDHSPAWKLAMTSCDSPQGPFPPQGIHAPAPSLERARKHTAWGPSVHRHPAATSSVSSAAVWLWLSVSSSVRLSVLIRKRRVIVPTSEMADHGERGTATSCFCCCCWPVPPFSVFHTLQLIIFHSHQPPFCSPNLPNSCLHWSLYPRVPGTLCPRPPPHPGLWDVGSFSFGDFSSGHLLRRVSWPPNLNESQVTLWLTEMFFIYPTRHYPQVALQCLK